jgi:hypothetical protein
MVSLIHEGVIALVRDEPAFAASLLRDILRVEVPSFDVARLTEATLNELVPIEYHADAVVLFASDARGEQPVFGTIFEVQLGRDDRKLFTWPLYSVAARARHECSFVVTVVTPDAAVARWASMPIDCGDNMIFRPRVIGPEGIPRVTDRDHAARAPQLAVLSVLAHGDGDVSTAVSIGLAAVHAVSTLPPEQQLLYSTLIQQALSEAARKAMAMESQAEKFFSDAQRRVFDHGRAEGKLEGRAEGKLEGRAQAKAEAVMLILQQRGLRITDEQHRGIIACTDLETLDRWQRLAFSVETVAELFA